MSEPRVIFFDNLIEADGRATTFGKTLEMSAAGPFAASNATGTICHQNHEEVVERARAFGARFKAGMQEQ
jgi:hypothetical protein